MPWLARLTDFLALEPRFQGEEALRLHVDGQALGWLNPATAAVIAQYYPQATQQDAANCSLQLAAGDYAGRSQALQALAEHLRSQGLAPGWRNEAMVLFDSQGRPYAQLERTLFRALGLRTRSVHLNAWVCTQQGAELWVAQRSASKSVDPGLRDNLVGGGVSAQESIALALSREAWEEAGLRFKRQPRPLQRLNIERRMRHGIQREHVYVHEAWLAPHFQPQNQDGEVAAQQRLPLPEVMTLLLAGHFTRDAALVILDGLCRQRFFGAETPAIRQTLSRQGLYD